MRSNPIIVLLVEDDCAHAEIIRRNLELSEVPCEQVHVENEQIALDYLYRRKASVENTGHDLAV